MKTKTIVHVIPSFHYDVAYQETYAGYLESALTCIREGLRLLRKHPDFTFTIEQTILIREFWNRYPRLRAAMRRFAAEGRLAVAPGMFTMPDSVPASGGTFQREGYLDQRAADADCYEWPKPRVMRDHPLTATVSFSYPELDFRHEITLRHGERLVRFRAVFTPLGRRYRLRVAFPVAVGKNRVRHSIPFGHITTAEGEYPTQGWMDLADEKKGLLLVNRGLPGNSVVKNVMMLSLFRTAVLDKDDGAPSCDENVEHIFEYGIMPFSANDQAYNPARVAALFNRPPMLVEGVSPAGVETPPPFVELDGAAEISCLRREGTELVVRLWETAGRRNTATLKFRDPVARCRRTDAAGGPARGPAACRGREVRLPLRPFEIATLRVAAGMRG